jgi:hypothetical protein
MSGGLLDALLDPVRMAEIEQRNEHRNYIVARLVEQMGISKEEAKQSLWNFDAITSSEGQTLH